MYEELSDCCGAPIYEDTDICTECKDHCGIMEDEDLMEDNWLEIKRNIQLLYVVSVEWVINL